MVGKPQIIQSYFLNDGQQIELDQRGIRWIYLVPVKGRSRGHQASRLFRWCFISFNWSICTCCCEEAASTYTKVSAYLKLCHSRALHSSHSLRGQSSADTSNGLSGRELIPVSQWWCPRGSVRQSLHTHLLRPKLCFVSIGWGSQRRIQPHPSGKNQRMGEWTTGVENICVPGLKAPRSLLKLSVYMALTLRWGPTTKSPFTITSINQFRIDLKA